MDAGPLCVRGDQEVYLFLTQSGNYGLDVAQVVAGRQRRMTGRAVQNFGVAACAVTTRPPWAAAASCGFAAR